MNLSNVHHDHYYVPDKSIQGLYNPAAIIEARDVIFADRFRRPVCMSYCFDRPGGAVVRGWTTRLGAVYIKLKR